MKIEDLTPQQIAALSAAISAGVDVAQIARQATADAHRVRVQKAIVILRGMSAEITITDALARVRAACGASAADALSLGDIHRAVRAGDVLRKRARRDGTAVAVPSEGAPLQSRDDRQSAARLAIVQGERGASPRAVARAVAAWDARITADQHVAPA